MSPVLTQEEIETLTQALQTEGGLKAALSVETRDFRRPLVCSTEELNQWKKTFSGAVQAISTAAGELLRFNVSVEITGIEQANFDSFMKCLPEICCVYRFKMDPLPEPGFLAIDPSVSLAVIDRLFGGSGKAKFEARGLRTLEKPVMDRFANQALGALAKSLSASLKFNPSLASFASAPFQVQTIEDRNAVLWLQLGIGGDLLAGTMHCVIPFANLSTNSNKAAAQTKTTQAKSESVAPIIQNALQSTPVEISAFLGHGDIVFSDLMSLEPGDVVPLNLKVGERAEIAIAGIPRCQGWVGVQDGRWSVELESPIIQKAQTEERGKLK